MTGPCYNLKGADLNYGLTGPYGNTFRWLITEYSNDDISRLQQAGSCFGVHLTPPANFKTPDHQDMLTGWMPIICREIADVILADLYPVSSGLGFWQGRTVDSARRTAAPLWPDATT